jgi:hypothetical protein
LVKLKGAFKHKVVGKVKLGIPVHANEWLVDHSKSEINMYNFSFRILHYWAIGGRKITIIIFRKLYANLK